MTKVAILMGSDSDLSIMKEAKTQLDEFNVECEMRVLSAHRTPLETINFAANAHLDGVKVIIAGAGGAAHLAGVIAAVTSLPVIGVPISQKNLQGLDSLLSMVQMPKGIPVATVAIDGAKNAALLALRIIGTFDKEVFKKYEDFRNRQAQTVLEKDAKLQDKLQFEN